jgi:hypothetical protein
MTETTLTDVSLESNDPLRVEVADDSTAATKRPQAFR